MVQYRVSKNTLCCVIILSLASAHQPHPCRCSAAKAMVITENKKAIRNRGQSDR